MFIPPYSHRRKYYKIKSDLKASNWVGIEEAIIARMETVNQLQYIHCIYWKSSKIISNFKEMFSSWYLLLPIDSQNGIFARLWLINFSHSSLGQMEYTYPNFTMIGVEVGLHLPAGGRLEQLELNWSKLIGILESTSTFVYINYKMNVLFSSISEGTTVKLEVLVWKSSRG